MPAVRCQRRRRRRCRRGWRGDGRGHACGDACEKPARCVRGCVRDACGDALGGGAAVESSAVDGWMDPESRWQSTSASTEKRPAFGGFGGLMALPGCRRAARRSSVLDETRLWCVGGGYGGTDWGCILVAGLLSLLFPSCSRSLSLCSPSPRASPASLRSAPDSSTPRRDAQKHRYIDH